MATALTEIITASVFIMQVVPIGTNIGLVRLLWSMGNGSFLISRGAVHGGLAASEFAAAEIRQSWAALRYGSWEINELLAQWQAYVMSRNEWCARRYGIYRVKSVDITGFWRPRLAGAVNKHYHALAQKALPAVVFGVLISSGNLCGRRVPLLQRVVRCPIGTSARAFRALLLDETVKHSAADEITVVDAGFKIAELQAAKVQRFVIRLATNCTARLNHLPPRNVKGRPQTYGALVRPLARKRGDQIIPATPAQTQGEFQFEDRTIRYASWHGLVTTQTTVQPDQATFTIHVFSDPRYKQPLVLATDLMLSPDLIFQIYRDRWPVEHPPLATKQMLGLHRQFVFATESCFRLPELGLLAGNLLSHTAALLPPTPAGFWDRSPQPTPGRLRRLLALATFPDFTAFAPELRKKNAVSDHLPKGIDAHRRLKAAA